MDDQSRGDIVVAITRIDEFLQRASRELERAKQAQPLPPGESGLQEAELEELDRDLEELANRLWQRPVSRSVWSPPGQAAFIACGGSVEPSRWLDALHGELRSSRAFFDSLLRSRGVRTAAAHQSLAQPAPGPVRKVADHGRMWIAVAVVLVCAVALVALRQCGADV